jgi:hypothetical protein
MYTSCCSGPAVADHSHARHYEGHSVADDVPALLGAFHQAAEEESRLGLLIVCSLDSLSANDNRQEQGSCFQVCFRLKPRKG